MATYYATFQHDLLPCKCFVSPLCSTSIYCHDACNSAYKAAQSARCLGNSLRLAIIAATIIYQVTCALPLMKLLDRLEAFKWDINKWIRNRLRTSKYSYLLAYNSGKERQFKWESVYRAKTPFYCIPEGLNPRLWIRNVIRF